MRCKAFLFALLFTLLCPFFASATGENIVIRRYCCYSTSWPSHQHFISEHPEVTFERQTDFIDTTEELVGQLITKQFQYDIMGLSTVQIDPHIVMKKGFYLDLSENETICKAVASMYPAFQQAAMYDGKLYALPYGIGFDIMKLAADDWQEAGYTDDDIPQSYEELLQFLEGLCERLEDDPDLPIHLYMRVNAMGDYDASDYTLLLTDWFLSDYITQKQMAGEMLSFDDEELASLLEKTKTVCSRLFSAERYLSPKETNTGLSLITEGNQMFWPDDGKYVLFFRMNNQLPKIIRVRLDMLSIYAGTEYPALCMEMLEDVVNYGAGGSYTNYSNAFLYQNATPIVSDHYETNRIPYQNVVTYFINELAKEDLEPLERKELEEKLEAAEASLKNYDEVGKYSVTQGMIDSYQQSTDLIYVTTPTPFAAGTPNGTQFQSLMKRFAQEQITTKEFLEKINELAYMVQAENDLY